ncbi:MAG: hypothetical protein ACKERG_04585 [Candidatus Hodgkinia cicadicola]
MSGREKRDGGAWEERWRGGEKVVGTAASAVWGWHDSGFEAKADVFEGSGEDVQICCAEGGDGKRARWLRCD